MIVPVTLPENEEAWFFAETARLERALAHFEQQVALQPTAELMCKLLLVKTALWLKREEK